MHEQHVGVAAAADVQRLSGADRDHPDSDSGRLCEGREQMGKQAGLLGGDGGNQHDAAVLRERGRKRGKAHGGKKARRTAAAEERHRCDLLQEG